MSGNSQVLAAFHEATLSLKIKESIRNTVHCGYAFSPFSESIVAGMQLLLPGY